MASPVQEDMMRLERIAKYLNDGNKRIYQLFEWGKTGDKVKVFSDSDWAGCKRTRKSTSGGVVSIGGSVIKHWSSTQKAIATSSQEAELYAAVKALSEAKGIQSLVRDFGEELGLELLIDAQAVVDLANRQGLGRARHVDVGFLWIQEALEREEFRLTKVHGKYNPADVLTKPVPKEVMDQSLWNLGFRRRSCQS